MHSLAAMTVTGFLILLFLAAVAWRMNDDRGWMAWAAIVVFADQVLKAAVRSASLPGQWLHLDGVGPRLLHFENHALGGGLSYNSIELWGVRVTPGLDVAGCLLILVAAYWALDYTIRQWHPRWPTPMVQGLGLIIGGGMGNWIDRVQLGSVTDFLPISPTLVCNVADVMIVAGFAVCLLSMSWVAWQRLHRAAACAGPPSRAA